MAVFTFAMGFYAFSDFTNVSGNVVTADTVSYPNGTAFTLNSDASPLTINITDDDGLPLGSAGNSFSDGFIDPIATGGTSGNGNQLLINPITVNGVTYPANSLVELEFAFTTTSGETFWVIRINGTNVGISGPTLPEPGTTYTVNGGSDGVSTPISTIPCFLKGTQIKTPDGEVAVEDLKAGDLVMTLDHGAQHIRWITGRALQERELRSKPHLRPIRISAGALGENMPARDLLVSPQHRILLRSKIAIRMFETDEVLVAAKKLLELEGIEIAEDVAPVWYFHFICDGHEIIEADGAFAETLFLGSEAVKSIGPDALEEITAIFGSDILDEQTFARPVPSGKQVRRFVERHQKNGKTVYAATV